MATERQFRAAALKLLDAEEGSHMGHADFRVGGRVFASLGVPKPGWGMVKLTPEQQAAARKKHPEALVPAAGAWGARGATHVLLKSLRVAEVRGLLELAWQNTAPAKLRQAFERET